MRKTKLDNAVERHNASITARPRILIPGSSESNDGFVLWQSDAGPHRIPAEIPDIRDKKFDFHSKKFYVEWGFETAPEPVTEFVVQSVLELTEQERSRLKSLSLLQYAHAITDAIAAKKALSDAASLAIDDKEIQRVIASLNDPRAAAEWLFVGFFNREIKSARTVVWRTKQDQFLPAIYCPNKCVASFVAVSYRGLAACLNCHKVFSPDSPSIDESTSEKYCTAACGQRYRQKLYRLKLKQKARAKKTSKRKGRR